MVRDGTETHALVSYLPMEEFLKFLAKDSEVGEFIACIDGTDIPT